MTEGDRPPSSKEVPQSNRVADDTAEPSTAVSQSGPPSPEPHERVPPEAAATETRETPGALVVVCGLPGVGKTTVAKRVARHVSGEILRTDVIRKELFDDPEYSDAETEAVYAELIRRARKRVTEGSSIVLDATFADARFREDVREVGDAVANGFDLIEVECDEAVVERRIERREGISDADFEIHRQFKQLFDRVEADHAVVDNSGTELETFAQVDAAFATVDGGIPGGDGEVLGGDSGVLSGTEAVTGADSAND